MQIFKFGGASLQNPLAIRELAYFIQQHKDRPLVVVVSAMGKITQALEEILHKQLSDQPYGSAIEEVYSFHAEIAEALLGNTSHPLQEELDSWKKQFIQDLKVRYLPEEIEKVYSQMVAWGEILSSRIIYHYWRHVGIDATWVDARKYIKTKAGFTNAQLDESNTKNLIKNNFLPLIKEHKLILTQGFIASDTNGTTTTLGKEGSDFTGAILAAALEATSLTIWKDVAGIMNGDPKIFKSAVKFDELDYETMAKMSFYGAQVVHPKTIYPLATNEIPLHIKSFQDKSAKGTIVTNKTHPIINLPIYILRNDQIFIRLSLGDFIFLEEGHMAMIFEELNRLSLRVNFLERTPYYLSVCLTNDYIKLEKLLSTLQLSFKTKTYYPACLLTIMHKIEQANLEFLEGKVILAEQRCESVYKLVYAEELRG